ncbi:MAG: hypothetical protein H6621_09020 [Halobacteriovoraceae bacterium]|nr:hypothetical protein [Halobacteriovoraceae bacterium]MCB9095195.1 hypothetical protein [Halobacteriovoraceae bacterium]
MILGKSKDPVLLKKIALEMWPLKEEILSTYRYYKKNHTDQIVEVKNYYENSTLSHGAQIGKIQQEDSTEVKEEESQETATSEQSEEGDDNVVDINTKEPVNKTSSKEYLELRNKITRIKPNSETISRGFVFLSDMNMDEVLFFSEKPYWPGQTIVFHLAIDRGFTICAEINYIKNIAMKSRIISDLRAQFRIKAKVLFVNAGDRTLLRNFLSSIEPEELKTSKSHGHAEKPKASPQESNGGESDDEDDPTKILENL